jgi:hypothetical protein
MSEGRIPTLVTNVNAIGLISTEALHFHEMGMPRTLHRVIIPAVWSEHGEEARDLPGRVQQCQQRLLALIVGLQERHSFVGRVDPRSFDVSEVDTVLVKSRFEHPCILLRHLELERRDVSSGLQLSQSL